MGKQRPASLVCAGGRRLGMRRVSSERAGSGGALARSSNDGGAARTAAWRRGPRGMGATAAGQEDRRWCLCELAWVGGGAAHSGMVVCRAWEATVAGQGGPKAVPARACVGRRRGHGREARVRDGES